MFDKAFLSVRGRRAWRVGPRFPDGFRLHCRIAYAVQLTNFDERQKPGHDGLGAAILVGAIGMKSITATSGFDIHQWNRKIIAAEKPAECPQGVDPPLGIGIGAPGCATR